MILKLDSHLPKKILLICFNESPLKMMKNAFHLKSTFHSQDILIFALTFWSCRRNGLIRKIKLISKHLMSQLG